MQNTLWLFYYLVSIIVLRVFTFFKRWWNSFVKFNLHARFGMRKHNMLTGWSLEEGFMLTDENFLRHCSTLLGPSWLSH